MENHCPDYVADANEHYLRIEEAQEQNEIKNNQRYNKLMSLTVSKIKINLDNDSESEITPIEGETRYEVMVSCAKSIKKDLWALDEINKQIAFYKQLKSDTEARIEEREFQIDSLLEPGEILDDPYKKVHISRYHTPKVVIAMKNALPMEYMDEKTTYTPNLKRIKAALEDGADLPARLVYSIIVK